MYLNSSRKTKKENRLSLTITWDVFESETAQLQQVPVLGLTITWDVFELTTP